MRKIRTSGLMSGEEKRSHWQSLNATALLLDSTQTLCIGAANQRKMFCDKLLRDLQELPDADRV